MIRLSCILFFLCFVILLPSNFVHSHNSPREQYFYKFRVHTPKPSHYIPNLSNFDLCTVFTTLTSGTDPTYIFIFTETPVLFPPNFPIYAPHGNMNGMSRPGFYLQTCFLLTFICIACFKHTAYCVQCKLLLYICKHKPRRLHTCKHCSAHKMRKLIARGKYIHVERLTATFLILLLLLCGDVHPHPGPILPGSRRHPDAQSINVGSWNVRTLLPTKRAAGRPTALIARELDRLDVDIAALSETRILGENVIQEVGGGYTFFLKGKPEGDKCYHGVGFAIRSKLVKHLGNNVPTGINERLMTESPIEKFHIVPHQCLCTYLRAE